MDRENPRRDEDTPHRERHENTPSASATPMTRRVSYSDETAFAYESVTLAASASTASDAYHTRRVAYPAEVEPPEADAPSSPLDDQPVIVPVLSAQPITQPFLRSYERAVSEPDLDEPDLDEPDLDEPDSDYRWPDDNESTSDDDEANVAFDVDTELINIPDSLSGQAFTRDDAFALRERNGDGWKQVRRTGLVLLSLTLVLSVAAFGAAVAASYLHRATDHLTIPSIAPTVGSYSNGIVVQPGSEGITPTPEAPKYQIGAWMSNNAPGGGSVKVFVRLTEDVAPIPQIPVTLSVQMPGGSVVQLGPTNTDGYGLATFTVNFGGARGAPIFVTASAKVGTEALTAQTVFVPA
ncbi:MAG TPA: hypothetical protein VJO13_00195 [Ktedonobacterales bacterium]|nr:hypothetical protein [Ktedonobacterales bacterium]